MDAQSRINGAVLEDALIDRGLTNRDLFEMLQKAKQRAKH